MHGGLPQHSKVADREQDTQLRWPHFVIRNLEVAHGVSGEVDLNRQHQISNEQAESDGRGHVAGKRKTAEKEEGAESVNNVIDIKAIARARVIAEAGQRSIKRVAQPVEPEAQDNENQAKAVGG